MTRTSKRYSLSLVALAFIFTGCASEETPGLLPKEDKSPSVSPSSIPSDRPTETSTMEPTNSPSTSAETSQSSQPTPTRHPPHSSPPVEPSNTPEPTTAPEPPVKYSEPTGPIPSRREWLKDVNRALAYYNAFDFLHTQADKHRKPMVNFDIDNTVLQSGFGPGSAFEKPGLAIPAMKKLIAQAHSEGYFVVFNTGRGNSVEKLAATKRQLREAGLKYDALWLRPESMGLVPGKQAGRKKYTNKGYVLVANFGNHATDLEGEPKALLSVKLPSYNNKLG